MKRNDNSSNSRAAELRQRRSQESEQRVRVTNQRSNRRAGQSGQRAGAGSQQAAVPTPSRPVVVRNTTFGTPIHRQVATSKPRRAYYVSLSTPGAELRLPSIPQIQIGWRLLSAAILITAGIGLFSLIFSPFFIVSGVTINGLERISATDVAAVIDVENFSIVEIDPAEIKQRLIERYPGLDTVNVNVTLPTNVVLDLKERTPVLAWRNDDDVQWIDAQGVLFPPTGEVEGLVSISSPESAPVVIQPAVEEDSEGEAAQEAENGPKLAKPVNPGPARLDPALLETAQKLAAHLPAGTPLVYLPTEGLGWEQPSGCDVFIGSDLSRFEVKLAAIQVIEQNLDQQGIVAELINARNLDAPYYRAEQ